MLDFIPLLTPTTVETGAEGLYYCKIQGTKRGEEDERREEEWGSPMPAKL